MLQFVLNFADTRSCPSCSAGLVQTAPILSTRTCTYAFLYGHGARLWLCFAAALPGINLCKQTRDIMLPDQSGKKQLLPGSAVAVKIDYPSQCFCYTRAEEATTMRGKHRQGSHRWKARGSGSKIAPTEN